MAIIPLMWLLYATLAIRIASGAVLLTSGIEKLAAQRRFTAVLERYNVGAAFARPFALAIATAETSIAAALLLGVYWRTAALFGAVMTLCFLAVLAYRSRLLDEDCGCGGLTSQLGLASHAAVDVAMFGGLLLVLVSTETLGWIPGERALVFVERTVPFDGIAAVVSYIVLGILFAGASAVALHELERRRAAIDRAVFGG